MDELGATPPPMKPRAAIVAIGSELVDGRLADTNGQRLDPKLAGMGFEVAYHVCVADRLPDIVEAIRFAARRAHVVILSGGLGPTIDDITRDAAAAVAEQELRTDEAALAHVKMIFDALGREMPENNARQGLFPEKAVGLPNSRGTAFGFRLDLDLPHDGLTSRIYALPGVPHELDAMFDAHVAPQLRMLAHALGAPNFSSSTLVVFGMSESKLDAAIADLCRDDDPAVSLNVRDGTVRITVTASGDDVEAATAGARARADAIAERLGRRVVDRDGRDLPEVVADLLERTGTRLAFAESCTGGMAAALITRVGGISKSFLESAVTYSNAAKSDRLGVDPGLIEAHGAVSAEVAQAMASGARIRSGADVAVSVTGIAGPDGGTAEKPVGLVYMAIDASPKGGQPFTEVIERRFGALARGGHGRERVRALSAMTMLDRLRVWLEDRLAARSDGGG